MSVGVMKDYKLKLRNLQLLAHSWEGLEKKIVCET